jgi:polar amino acid transport system permease protein
VILPQALRLALPTWANEVIYMIKYASVVYTIAVPELLARGQMLNAKYFKPVPIFFAVSVIYITVITLIAMFTDSLERKLRIPGLAMESARD